MFRSICSRTIVRFLNALCKISHNNRSLTLKIEMFTNYISIFQLTPFFFPTKPNPLSYLAVLPDDAHFDCINPFLAVCSPNPDDAAHFAIRQLSQNHSHFLWSHDRYFSFILCRSAFCPQFPPSFISWRRSHNQTRHRQFSVPLPSRSRHFLSDTFRPSFNSSENLRLSPAGFHQNHARDRTLCDSFIFSSFICSVQANQES